MESTKEQKMYRAKHRDEGIRLDNFLAASLHKENPGMFSRAMISEMISCGQVLHNGEKTTKPDKKVLMNDAVSLELSPLQPKKKALPKQVLDPEILFEDEAVLFVNKPAGLLTHAVQDGDVSLTDWLISHCPQVMQVGGDRLRPGIVHRLDKETSGILVIAKTQEAFIGLKQLFEEREIEKTYFALVEGHLSEPTGKISFPITRIPHSEKRSVRRATHDTEARAALTHFQLLTRFENCDLVLVKPKTGRTHQIRIHFSAIQHPIIGDRLYGFRRKSNSVTASRHMLHAGRLVLSLFGKMYDIEAPLPSDFANLIASLTVSE
ncbi:MAG: RluA family pseudouridine synthase [Candidatus Moranbacteria bacterium]|nr:RluA family pseudouridine synthase [Candidatus Moranbacteria bacterium]MBP9801292.1 RluA family pseudouridine synthase [Candidatus Moranbacteria bacterium]